MNAAPKKKVLRLQEEIVQENLCVFNTVTKQNKCALWVSVSLKSLTLIYGILRTKGENLQWFSGVKPLRVGIT